jgi:Fe2+ transport system protein FeoA
MTPSSNSEHQWTLADAPVGRDVRIRFLRHPRPDISTRLRELGIYENAVIRCVLRGNGNIICEVRNMRIGLDSRLAGSIMVTASEESRTA